jgi:hypothetical protein
VATLASLSAPAVRSARRLARGTVLSTVDASLSTLDAVLRSPLAQEVIDRVLASALAEDVLERLVGRAVDSPDAERLVGRVIDSRLVDMAMLQLLESDGLWVLVEQIAQSPAVTDAISQQGVGFADQMAGVVRDRSRIADDRLERLGRRLARRAPRDAAPPGSAPAPGP